MDKERQNTLIYPHRSEERNPPSQMNADLTRLKIDSVVKIEVREVKKDNGLFILTTKDSSVTYFRSGKVQSNLRNENSRTLK